MAEGMKEEEEEMEDVKVKEEEECSSFLNQEPLVKLEDTGKINFSFSPLILNIYTLAYLFQQSFTLFKN